MKVVVRALTFPLLLIGTVLNGSIQASERVLAPPHPIPAGEAAEGLLARWLREGNDVEAAWAAWTASERGLGDLGPAVVARLGHEVAREGKQPRSLLQIVLMDAVIALDAEVPDETLRGCGYATDDVVTYLCRRKASGLHMDAFEALDGEERRAGGTAWLAIGGHLYAAKDQAFARRLLLNWQLERVLRVWDAEGPYPAYRRPSGQVVGDGIAKVPDGYPPIPRRWISLTASDGWDRLVEGPFPVYGSRSVDRGKRIGFGSAGGEPVPDVARREWLRGWLGTAAVPDIPQWAIVDVKWSGGRRAWARLSRAVVTDLQARWRAWRDALLSRGLLAADPCQDLAPNVKWSVQDERRLRKRPLPPICDVYFEHRLPQSPTKPAPRRDD